MLEGVGMGRGGSVESNLHILVGQQQLSLYYAENSATEFSTCKFTFN
jgi:hypothetical protein